jgi:hypothetical protein
MAPARAHEPGTQRPAVFIGFTEISGYFHNLREGLEQLGYRCDFVELVPHPFGYGYTSRESGLVVSLIRAARARDIRTRSPVLRRLLALSSGLLMVTLFLSAVAKYDVFLFTYGNSFFAANLDLPLLKLLGKRIVMPFLGSEVRPRYIDGFLDFPSVEEMHASAQEQEKKLRFIERFVDLIINNPAAGHLLERPFVNFYCLGIPQGPGGQAGADSQESPPPADAACQPPSVDRRVRILHTPSVRTGKGSDLIRTIVEQLGARYPIEYTEAINRPHAEVLELIRSSDLVIDQAYSDTPMAAFASESAWFGVPAVVGGYYSAVIGNEVADEFVPPSRFVLPEDLESAVESLIADPVARCELGERAREFVRTRWSRAEVASRYACVIRGEIPHEWWFDPGRMTYLYGCGLTRDQAVTRISAMIEEYGPESLGLRDKKDLVERFSAAVEQSPRHPPL